MSNSLYERDFYAWANEQAALLRAGNFSAADIEIIGEELDTLGRGEQRELTSRLASVLALLLAWEAMPEQRGRRSSLAIREKRVSVSRLLNESPSLRTQLPTILEDAYGDAVLIAARELDRDEEDFPAVSPWTFDQAMTGDLTA